jgi:7-cyano-7-deazaguanine synthase
MKKGVILLSGGLDSAVTLYLAKRKGYKLTALLFDYGQRQKREIDSAKKIARLNGIDYRLVKCGLPWVKSALTVREIKVPSRQSRSRKIPVTYVSGRNIIFLSYAASCAESLGARTIFIGAHVQDYSGYPDCRPSFLKSFQKALKFGLKDGKIRIAAPLLGRDKTEIVKLGIKLGVPFEYTWSCYRGGKTPCLKCDSCRFRTTAFSKLGRQDPLLRK